MPKYTLNRAKKNDVASDKGNGSEKRRNASMRRLKCSFSLPRWIAGSREVQATFLTNYTTREWEIRIRGRICDATTTITTRVKELASESWKRAGSLSRAVRLAFRPTHRRRLFRFYLLLFFFSALKPVIGIFASRHASRTESLMSYVGIEKVEAGSLTCCQDLNNATIRIEWRGSNVFKVPYVGLVKCLL